MAEKMLTLPARDETLRFSREIISVQTQEIRQMKLLLGEEMSDMRHGH